MATAVELATGYVTLTVDASRVAPQVAKAFAGAERIGAKAGAEIGSSMASAWNRSKPDVDELSADVDKAAARMTAAIERNATKQESAKRKVAIAQAKANEATQKYGASSSQALTASDRLALAQQKLEATTLGARKEQDKLSDELLQATAAHGKAARQAEAANQVFGRTPKALFAGEKAFEDLQAAANKTASSAEGSAQKYAAGWRGVGQRIRAHLVGGVDDAVDAADREASGSSGGAKYAAGWSGVGARLRSTLTRGVKQASDAAEGEADRGGKRAGGGFATAFKGAVVGLGAYVGVREIGQSLWSSVQDAGDLEQSVGAIGSVFKENAGQMMQWSLTAASSVGLAANEYNELGTLLGSQLKNGGTAMDELAPKTNQLIGLGSDLASMFGGTTADAVGALSSALKGERDPIERYGVSLNQAAVDAKAAQLGFEKVDGALSAEANQAATLALIMDQTTDAHGNFAAESDTFAHKQQVMAAQWQNLKTRLGEAFLPALSATFQFISDKAIPALTEIAGGVRAFAYAWVAADGDITSSGFPGFMEATAFTLRNVYDRLVETAPIWGPFAIGIAAVATAYGIYSAAAWAAAAATNAAIWPVTAVIVGIGLLVGAIIIAYNRLGWFKNAVDWAFAGIKVAVGAVVSWWTSTAWPWLLTGFQVIGAAATWLWRNVMVPAWYGIRVAVAVVGAILMTIFQGLTWFVRNVLAPTVVWLWRNIFAPSFSAIGSLISFAWNQVIKPIFSGIRWTVVNLLAPAFTWFYGSVIVPVWNSIWSAISVTWTWIRDKVFNPLGDAIERVMPGSFRKGVDAIERIWSGLKSVAKSPVKFVVETVLNKGLIGNFNKLAEKVGIGKLPDVKLPQGFAVGGWTGPGGRLDPAGVVHADEFVVRKWARRRFERENPGVLDHINRTGEAPTGTSVKRSQSKDGAYAVGPSGGPSAGIWGSIQNEMMRTGRLYVPNTTVLGVNAAQAAKAWMGRSALEIIAGSGSPGVRVRAGTRGPWGYADTSGLVDISPSAPSNRRMGVMIHELGHVLSLVHPPGGYSATSSVMSAGMAGGDFPHAADFAALARVWGKPGQGVKQYSADEVGVSGGGFGAWLVETFISPMRDVVSGIMDRIREANPKAGMWIDMAGGVGKKLGNGLIDFALDKINFLDGGSSGDATAGAERWRSTISQALKHVGLPTAKAWEDAWVRQVGSESGGDPNARQQVVDVNSGRNAALGLLQVTLDTWNRHRDPELPNDRKSPFANSVAAMRYARARYGVDGMLQVIGRGHGYSGGGLVSPFALTPQLFDGGGLLHEGLTLVDHRKKDPDRVLSAPQWDAMFTIAEYAGSGRNQTVNVNVGTRGDEDPTVLGRRVGEKVAFELEEAMQ